MKHFIESLFYISLFAFLINAAPFQKGFATFGCNDSAACFLQNNHHSDSDRADFFISIEEIETSEEEDTDSSGPNACLDLNFANSKFTSDYFIDFLKTAIAFVSEKALYIRYSSLKIPFHKIRH